MAGLQDISPTVDQRCVTRATWAPMRAAAVAASVPACPPPTTTTSYVSVMLASCTTVSCETSFADAERGEYPLKHVLNVDTPKKRLQGAEGQTQIFGNEFQLVVRKTKLHPFQCRIGLLKMMSMPRMRRYRRIGSHERHRLL